jgi:hypothetical protein
MSLPRTIIGNIRSAQNRCRMLVSACVTLILRTNVRKWRKVAFAGPPSWDARNQVIAGFIPAGTSVLDIGCGAQTLKRYLKPGCHYQPCDVVQSSPDVIFCDFNAGIYPDIKERFDWVVCSGVLEYIRKPEVFLRRIPGYGRSLILSYNPLPPGGSKLKRLGNGWGWVNHFKKQALETLFDEMGLKWTLTHSDRIGYVIYALERQQGSQDSM